MIAFRRLVLAGLATLLVAGACTSINVPTIPPINIPSIPPINIASIPPINLPSIPVIGLPGSSNGIQIPGVSIPPGEVPCTLVTAAEIGQIWGTTSVSDQSDNATDCTFLLTLTSGVSVQSTSDTDLSGTSILFGNTAQQSTIGGFPAVSGVVFGQPAVYVQKPSGQLQVLGVLTGSDPATITKLQQVATIAVARMP